MFILSIVVLAGIRKLMIFSIPVSALCAGNLITQKLKLPMCLKREMWSLEVVVGDSSPVCLRVFEGVGFTYGYIGFLGQEAF
jgi:hypothetical protein